MVTLSDAQSATVTTDANGFCTFGLLQAGAGYTVSAFAPGQHYAPQSVVNLQKNALVNFAPPIYQITGRVTDANGNSLKNIAVTLTGERAETTRTDMNGNYSFKDVIGLSDYTLAPVDASLTFAPASQTLSNLSANQNINFAATVAVNPAPTPTPSDDFGGASRDPNRWSLGALTQNVNPNVTVVQQNGQLVITPAANQAALTATSRRARSISRTGLPRSKL